MSELRASIIVCTRNRSHFLEDCVAAVCAQSIKPESFELLLVDNGSEDDTAEVCAKIISHRHAFNIRYLREETPGLSAARNAGWRAARADLVSFIDDDALVDPAFLQELVSAFDRSTNAASIGGRILPVFQGELPGWFSPLLKGYLSLQDLGGDERAYRPHEFAYGCNMAFRKSWLEKVGGFDPEMKHAEDKDIAWKLNSEGALREYHPKVVVRHCVPESRLTLSALDGIAKRTGEWELKRVRRLGRGSILMKRIEYYAKLCFAIGASIAYACLGRISKGRALVRYRLALLAGFRHGLS